MLTLGADLSHYQLRPNIAQLVDDGAEYFVLKATQGMAVDPDFDWLRGQIEQQGKLWAAYHWVLPGDTEAAITHCVEHVLGTGDFLALDWEQSGVTSDVVERDMTIAEQALRRPGMLYRGRWPPAPVTPRMLTWAWWYPQYPQDPNAAPTVPLWDGTSEPDWSKECLLWQYTGTGRLAGLTTSIDLDRALCPLEVLKSWWKTSSWTGVPAQKVPPPTPDVPAGSFSGILLHRNGSGPDYALLQERLNLCAGAHLVVDGHMGPATEAALVAFQGSQGLAPDGIAGPTTFAKLASV